eukprot:Nk52_evm7s2171 gene=Nk52_evmTU7s2171
MTNKFEELYAEKRGEGLIAEVSSSHLYNVINSGCLTPYVCDPGYMLLLDLRSEKLYNDKHIFTSVSLSKKYNNDMRSLVSSASGVAYFIVYDSSGQSLDTEKGVGLSKEFQNFCSGFFSYVDAHSEGVGKYRRKVGITYLKGGFNDFEEKFPFLTNAKADSSNSFRKNSLNENYVESYYEEYNKFVNLESYVMLPSEIVEDKLFLGKHQHITTEVMGNLNIRAIVNASKMAVDCEGLRIDKDNVLDVDVEDRATANIYVFFTSVCEFMAKQLAKNHKVFVCCAAGVSRSSTLVICFLMYQNKWTLKEAYDYVKNERSIIHPNGGFMNQLSEWEEKVLGKVITDVDAEVF